MSRQLLGNFPFMLPVSDPCTILIRQVDRGSGRTKTAVAGSRRKAVRGPESPVRGEVSAWDILAWSP